MKHRYNEPTPEQRERMETAARIEECRFARMREEMKTVYNNTRCPVCGDSFMTGIICRLHRGVICETHCNPRSGESCRYFQKDFFKCLYREE